jgi:cobaltochelatase CobT
LALILREHLTGEPVPDAAAAGVEMVRMWIEHKAGKDFDALAANLEDQKAFQHLALDMLGHLELTRAEIEPNGEDEDNPDAGDQQDEDEQPGNDAQEMPQPVESAAEPSRGKMRATATPMATCPRMPTMPMARRCRGRHAAHAAQSPVDRNAREFRL